MTLIDLLKANGWYDHLQTFFSSTEWNDMRVVLSQFPANSITPVKNSIFKPFQIKYDDVNCIIIGEKPNQFMATGHAFECTKRPQKQTQTSRFIEELEFADKGFVNSSRFLFSGLRSQGVMMINDQWVYSTKSPLDDYINNNLWEKLTDAVLIALAKKPRMVYIFLNEKVNNTSRIPFTSRFNHLILQGSLINHFNHTNTVAELLVKTNEYLSKTNNQIKWLQTEIPKEHNLPVWTYKDEMIEEARILSH